jgi:hypothetical protein
MENSNQFLQKIKIEIDKIPPTKTEFNVITQFKDNLQNKS